MRRCRIDQQLLRSPTKTSDTKARGRSPRAHPGYENARTSPKTPVGDFRSFIRRLARFVQCARGIAGVLERFSNRLSFRDEFVVEGTSDNNPPSSASSRVNTS